MANPNPDTSGLQPGQHKRQKGPGESVRLSAYLLDDQQRRLAAHMDGRTPYQASRELARLIMLGLEASEKARD